MSLFLTAAAVSRIEKSGNDLATIADDLIAHRKGNRCLPLRVARRYAVETMSRCGGAMKSMDFIVWNADDSLDLVRFGPRGGRKRITRLWDRNGKPV